jgi:hypothetical protein
VFDEALPQHGIAAKMKLSAYCAAAILAYAANAIPQPFGGVKVRNVSSSACAVVSSSAAVILAATPSGMTLFAHMSWFHGKTSGLKVPFLFFWIRCKKLLELC